MADKLRERVTFDCSGHDAWLAFCPACGRPHAFDSRWTFDGDMRAPSFEPSMLEWTPHPDAPGDRNRATSRCHSFLRKGVWEYLPDSTHRLAGQKVPLPDWPVGAWPERLG
jgi:hypothetical protein